MELGSVILGLTLAHLVSIVVGGVADREERMHVELVKGVSVFHHIR